MGETRTKRAANEKSAPEGALFSSLRAKRSNPEPRTRKDWIASSQELLAMIRPTSALVNDQTKQGSYGQFCPVAMAAEIICSRWTALILREMLCGTTRFSVAACR
jgi:hypothetical protein